MLNLTPHSGIDAARFDSPDGHVVRDIAVELQDSRTVRTMSEFDMNARPLSTTETTR